MYREDEEDAGYERYSEDEDVDQELEYGVGYEELGWDWED